ncbi:MAG: hypothetical protein G01um10147_1062 [Microgenomates group bacterium Gr01-1014_7]|nr:MAG: hypothetical protein G01um10147_1062 [Microgenomates group bacterium Gr01-1014_7]
MSFSYIWKRKEANFGSPIEEQVEGGTHITCEVILKKDGKYLAVRRSSIPGHESPPKAKKFPKGCLYFVHNLFIYGESVGDYLNRVIKEQIGVGVKSYKIIALDSNLQEKDNNWSFCPYVLVEVDKLPVPGNYGNDVVEVVTFTKENVPEDFGWWEKEELKEFLEKYD